MSEQNGNQLGIFEFFRSFTRKCSKRSDFQENRESDRDKNRNTSPTAKSDRETPKIRNCRRRRSNNDTLIKSDSDERPCSNGITKQDREAIRLRIRKKYGMINDTYEQASKDDVEEFENIDARVRPAKPKMRRAKLRSNSTDESSADPTRIGETAEKTAADDLVAWESDDGNKLQKKTEKSLSDIPILLAHIEDLEHQQKKSAYLQRRLQKKLAKKEVVIKELTDIIKSHQKAAKEKNREKEKQPENQRPVVRRTLEIIKKQRLLESSLGDEEATALRNFFEASEPKPNTKIVNLIDKALDFVVYMLLNRSAELSVTVDDEMRLFLFNNVKAKQSLFSEMMANPEYLPREWGSEQVIRRFQKNSNDNKRYNQNGTDDDADATVLGSAKAFVDFFYNNTNNQKNTTASDNENTLLLLLTSSQKIKPDVDRWLQERAEQRRKKSKGRRE
ncbi:hypothetical protein DICVIV_06275 [Dictyocaulus viviparus]|uniref:DUF7774 domain-containing protein n=1 Tax=Dictyocaulus viviparus TaxID=29172 RepID=A0A0D8XZ34_DICVI|nr:hypothetical protein DICVIV_06275 [Dictyocaulus viviparus]